MVMQVRQSPQTVQNVVTYDVVVGVDNPDLALKPGMTAADPHRHRPAHRRAARAEPGAALCARRHGERYPPQWRHAAQAQVWVLRDGKPVAVPVTPGSTTTPTPRSSTAS